MPDVYFVFNQLCLPSSDTAANHYHVHAWMNTFVEVLREGRRYSLEIRSRRDMINEEIVPGYSMQDWLKDRRVDMEARRLFRARITNTPYLDPFPDIEDKFNEMDFIYNGGRSEDLGYAFLLDGIAISLATDASWDATEIKIIVQQLTETLDGSIEIDNQEHVVRHITKPTELLQYLSWIEERRANLIQDGTILLEKWLAYFPRLDLTSNARQQIAQLRRGSPQLTQLIKHLFELNNYCQQWTSGGFEADKLKNVSPESESVRNNSTMRGERTFMCEDGQERFFEWHRRLTPGAWRLYFYPLPEEKRAIIGYIGPHLTTARF